MKVDIETLKDTFKIGYEEFEDSRNEAQEVIDLYHNRQYTQTQLNTLKKRKQPAETYNVIKQYSRMFIGYFSSVMTTLKTIPTAPSEAQRSAILTDTISNILEDNEWDLIKDTLALDKLLSGFSCIYITVVPTGKKDDFGRNINKLKLERIDPSQVIRDPMSTKPDYSDARFVHVFQWITEDDLVSMFGKNKLKKLDAFYNFTDATEAEYTYKFDQAFTGGYKVHNNYLIVHSIMRDDQDKYWSVYWHNDVELDRQEILYEDVKIPYLISRVHDSNKAEDYGIFREIVEPQKSINQAIIQIQLMVNSTKIFYDPDAVKDPEEFKVLVNRVNAAIPMLDLNGYKVENMNANIVEQYHIIDRNLDRIQRLLSINDSFLGMADASDSGRKVKLQQNASIVALRYLTNRLEFMYTNLGKAMVALIKQYYTANQMLSVANMGVDEERKWFEINKPFMMPTGRWAAPGVPEFDTVYEEVPSEENEPRRYKLINESDTDLGMADVRVQVVTAQYNDTDDIERVFMDSLIQGPAGQVLVNTSPPSYLRLIGMSIENTKTRNSMKIAQIFKDLANKMEGVPDQDPRAIPQQQGAQPGGQSGSMMHASGLTNFANPTQGDNIQ